MVSVVQPQDASAGQPPVVPLSASSSHVSRFLTPRTYQVEEIEHSECALVVFAWHKQSSTRVVIKILQAYQDTRYHLATQQERQQCQLEALEQNRRFTPEVYLGLAQVEDLDLGRGEIVLGRVITHPRLEDLESEHEYALVMRRLPENRRLDVIVRKDEPGLQQSLQILAERIALLHQTRASPLPPEADWGSNAQLHAKLLHNFYLLDLILTTEDRHHSAAGEGNLEQRIGYLKDGLSAIFTRWEARGYFERRVIEQRIKRCHGDLKSPNIWMLARKPAGKRHACPDVFILDGADFNPSYTHIDILSDIALLVVDIQARTSALSPLLADHLAQSYLQCTEQCDALSCAILGYYLVEKAMVGAAVSLVYDHLPELGGAFLRVAEQRLESLAR